MAGIQHASGLSMVGDRRPTERFTGFVRGALGHAWLLCSPPGGTDAAGAARGMYAWLAEELASRGLVVVHERVFGRLAAASVAIAARAVALRQAGFDSSGPVTFVEGAPPWGEGLAGLVVHAVERGALEGDRWIVRDGGATMGVGWRGGGAAYLCLQGLNGAGCDGNVPGPGAAAARAIRQADTLLHAAGMTYRDVARTWFYLDGILEWYDDFNAVRTKTYGDLGMDGENGLPASTGVGARSLGGHRCTLDLLAVARTRAGHPPVRFVDGVEQGAPRCYGSSFSRAAVIDLPGGSLIQVSGTAAIDRVGRSLSPGDASGQAERTLDAIEGLLASERASLRDACAATAFVKCPEDARTFWRTLVSRGLEDLPVVCVVADICRPELLFELDAEAVLPRPPG
jgi:enamine deaminase RidA (YjgF/YER057c/UK114 family)